MDTEHVTSDTWRSALLGYIGGAVMIMYGLFLLMVIFLTDTLPYAMRTIAAVAGLDEDEAELIERLNDARSAALMSNQPYGLYDEFNSEWDTYTAAIAACWQAELAPWRIKLAGGPPALWMRP